MLTTIPDAPRRRRPRLRDPRQPRPARVRRHSCRRHGHDRHLKLEQAVPLPVRHSLHYYDCHRCCRNEADMRPCCGNSAQSERRRQVESALRRRVCHEARPGLQSHAVSEHALGTGGKRGDIPTQPCPPSRLPQRTHSHVRTFAASTARFKTRTTTITCSSTSSSADSTRSTRAGG